MGCGTSKTKAKRRCYNHAREVIVMAHAISELNKKLENQTPSPPYVENNSELIQPPEYTT